MRMPWRQEPRKSGETRPAAYADLTLRTEACATPEGVGQEHPSDTGMPHTRQVNGVGHGKGRRPVTSASVGQSHPSDGGV